jgi:hypothetical protein
MGAFSEEMKRWPGEGREDGVGEYVCGGGLLLLVQQ